MKYLRWLSGLGDPGVELLLGKTLTKIEVHRDDDDGDKIVFTLDTGERYKLYHERDCCEVVTIKDIAGDLHDLVGSPLVMAEETTNRDEDPPEGWDDIESHTWTFYKFATIKGYVTISWFGGSNGYYSESVDFKPC